MYCVLRMSKEYHDVLLSDPTAILGERGTKNSSILKMKVPFITHWRKRNFHCLLRMRREYHVVLLSEPTAVLGGIGKKNRFEL
jgi:hypothetical protein